MCVRLRPHHVLCTVGFQGRGYSAEFVQNYTALKATLTPDTSVRVVMQTDNICDACPHQRGDLCTKEAKIQRLDMRHTKALGLEKDAVYTWGVLLNRARQHIQPDDLDTLCKGCAWLPLGICKEALITLRAEKNVAKKSGGTL